MKTLNKLCGEIHGNAVNHGFYDKTETDSRRVITHERFAQIIALIHSELSEALEADRENKYADLTSMEEQGYDKIDFNRSGVETGFECYVKDTVEDELADVIIRVLDLCGRLNIDIEKHVDLKMKYNQSRQYKHGKKY